MEKIKKFKKVVHKFLFEKNNYDTREKLVNKLNKISYIQFVDETIDDKIVFVGADPINIKLIYLTI
jgi:hypothetical protein